MEGVIAYADQITPHWLTQVQRRAGTLQQGHVTSITTTEADLPGISRFARLLVYYSPDADSAAPTQLLLKMSPAISEATKPFLRNKEVAFYHALGSSGTKLPVVPCLDAASNAETGAYHLLLSDVSQTHYAVMAGQLPPLIEHSQQMVDALAQIHAYWWDHPTLRASEQDWPTEASQAVFVTWASATYPQFADFLADRLSPGRRQTFEHILSALPRVLQRLVRGTQLTLVHGDAHVGNVLFPHDARAHSVRIVDWDWWQVSVGPMDLAYHMSLMWPAERRTRFERQLVERYYQTLLTHGVMGYTWDTCWNDYRFSVLRTLFIPMWRWSIAPVPDFWWLLFEKVMGAFEDLQCREHLDV